MLLNIVSVRRTPLAQTLANHSLVYRAPTSATTPTDTPLPPSSPSLPQSPPTPFLGQPIHTIPISGMYTLSQTFLVHADAFAVALRLDGGDGCFLAWWLKGRWGSGGRGRGCEVGRVGVAGVVHGV